MLIISIKDGESIERAIKRYKRKRKNVKLREEINDKKHYVKKSDAKRKKIEKAKHKEQFLREREQ
ncbi:MAG: 30S ribosomal protein S21 [Flavobacteriaceae bacterium]|nr:30S ribosomal protein S21 [Mangrovimonas sp.]MCB0432168.1 30S ribosomal protein S21 [Mangrovimonas sp.]MCB0435665.1 30S ribosomal protein S21 [Mangrovimonas sp.]MCB0469438.1 30S ribosomal protein S21 [Flavobacteriaceae bacterium]HPF98103.1 30S ribosomal protein S21 [Mangrovimonas sp.]